MKLGTKWACGVIICLLLLRLAVMLVMSVSSPSNV